MDSSAMSFEAKIALALGGSNWQSLQSNNTAEPSNPVHGEANGNEQVGLDEEDEDDEDDGVPLEPEDIDPARPQEPIIDEATLKKRKRKQERFDKTIERDAGEVLETIDADALVPVIQNVVWDRDPELLCCYNWQSSTDGTNTIFVPGEPAKWSEPALPHTLQRDSGFQYQDYNYARQPRDPFSPMFQALSVMNPNYEFNDIDVLADRNSLRVLLEFTQGKSNGPFRLNLYLVFNTLVIVRRQSRWWKVSDGQSYGINFERDFTKTTPDMQDATSHYRAIRYRMGRLNVVCRFEADAYDDGLVPDDLTPSEAAAVSGNGAGPTTRPSFNYSAPVRVLQKGHIVPTAQMLELKTQAYHADGNNAVQCQDQLWFGRTSLLYTAPYDKETGHVRRIKKENAAERVAKWEQTQQEPLQKLVSLLTHLRAVLRRERRPNRAVVLVREAKSGPIVLRTMEERSHAVDRETRERFWPFRAQPQGGYHGGRGAFHGQRGRGQGYGEGGRGDAQVAGGRGRHAPYPNRGHHGGHHGAHSRGHSGGHHGGHHPAPRGRGQSYSNVGASDGRTHDAEQRGGSGRGRGGSANMRYRGQGSYH